MKNERTQYTKYHERMKSILKESNMGCFSFVEDVAFDEFGEYFYETIKIDKSFKLYRYTTVYNDENGCKLDLENIYLTKNGVQNDIFEGLPNDDYNIYSQDDCVDRLTNIAYIKCFSETFKNNLMWSHYADSHKGICVEYDICKLANEDIIKQIFPVHYSKKREMFASVELLLEYINGNTEFNSLRDAKGIFLSKADIWRYEKEWRICHMNHELSEEEVRKIPFDCISAIYMGIRISKNDMKCIKCKLNSYEKKFERGTTDRIKLYKMKMPNDNSYNLTIEEVDY